MYSEDSLKVSENEDGTFCIEWDPNDPKYAIFNTMSEQELQEYINRALEEAIKEHEENESAGS
jgi:hypothetical protein